MRIEHSDDDALIARLINVAIGFVDVRGALGKAMITQTWGEWLAPNPSVVYLSLGPVQGTVRPDRSCIRITTVVGSQRHRNPKVAKHWFLSPQSAVIARAEVGQVAIITSEDNEAAPVEPKEDAEVQKIAKPKFGDFQGFKRT